MWIFISSVCHFTMWKKWRRKKKKLLAETQKDIRGINQNRNEKARSWGKFKIRLFCARAGNIVLLHFQHDITSINIKLLLSRQRKKTISREKSKWETTSKKKEKHLRQERFSFSFSLSHIHITLSQLASLEWRA